MLDHQLIFDLGILLAASLPILLICRKINLPSIVGFLATGFIIGPNALGWISDPEVVHELAEFGVALILFFIGLEFPLERLRSVGRAAVVSGTLQMTSTVTVVALATMFSVSIPQAIFAGLLVAFSSTAVVLPLIKNRGELHSPYGQKTLGVLLFQDLAVIPVVLLLPTLVSKTPGVPALEVIVSLVTAIAGMILLVGVGRYVVPLLLRGVGLLGSREGLTAGLLVVVVSLVLAAERTGISPALGAFAAGIILAESEFLHEISATLRPFRDILSSTFFASVGMFLSPYFLIENPVAVLGTVTVVVAVKILCGYPALLLAPSLPSTAMKAAFPLATVGEFSFVVAQAGRRYELLTPGLEQLFLATAVLTMAGAPILLGGGRKIATQLGFGDEPQPEPTDAEGRQTRIVVVGYGLNGRNLARALSETGIPFVVIEEDPSIARLARDSGSTVILGDATAPETLAAAGAATATAIVIVISDVNATRRIIRIARSLGQARIIVRTRYVSEVDGLRSAGADEIIPEEFETSIEILTRLLRHLHVPGNIVATQLRIIRDETYRLLREPAGARDATRRMSALVEAGTAEIFLVLPGTTAEGKTIAEIDLGTFGVAVPALLREGAPLIPLADSERLAAGDTLLLVGDHDALTRAISHLEKRPGQ